MRIVVVEQEAALGQFLARTLRSEEHEAEWLADGEAALEYADRCGPDLMVLDLLLPKLSGFEVLRQMRLRHSNCSLIVLMAEDVVETRVRCFDAGADDCVTKPFSLQELVARCKAHLRRRAQLNGSVVEYGDVVLRRRDRTVTRSGAVVELTTKEFRLLEHLMDRRGRCVSRAELLRDVFGQPESAGTNVVEVYINYLRRKLDSPAQKQSQPLIQTVRGSGYRIGDVSGMGPRELTRKPMLRAVSL